LAFCLLLAGCNDRLRPYLGHWDGEFAVSSSSVPAEPLKLHGYVQLYETGDKFIIEIANPVQKLTLKGNWKLLKLAARPTEHGDFSARMVDLFVTDFGLEQLPVERLRVTHRAYIEPAALHAAFGKPVVLRLSEDGKHLEGLLTTIGPMMGRFEFSKGNTTIGPTAG
jgi:hypothetical protein